MTDILDKAVLNHAFARIARDSGRKNEAISLVYEAAHGYHCAGRDSFAIRAIADVAGAKEARAYRAQMQVGERKVVVESMEDENSSL